MKASVTIWMWIRRFVSWLAFTLGVYNLIGHGILWGSYLREGNLKQFGEYTFDITFAILFISLMFFLWYHWKDAT